MANRKVTVNYDNPYNGQYAYYDVETGADGAILFIGEEQTLTFIVDEERYQAKFDSGNTVKIGL